MKRVNKRQALKHWLSGGDIGLLPCKASPNSIGVSVSWHNPQMWLENKFNDSDVAPHDYWRILYHTDNAGIANFQNLLNYYTHYNCNFEVGDYPHFYIK